MKFLRVNLTETDQCLGEMFRRPYAGLGGQSTDLNHDQQEVEPTEQTLSEPDNKLIFAPGYFTGTPLINTSRLSVGAKSPLTGGIKESNVGWNGCLFPGAPRHRRGYYRRAGCRG